MIKMNPSFCQNFNKYKIYPIILIFSLILFSNISYGTQRQLYVGDLIEIEISSTNLTKDSLSKKFLDNKFEIVNIVENKNNFILTLRTFETGDKKINIGSNELTINVVSTLDKIKQEKLFEGSSFFSEGKFSFNSKYFLITLGITLSLISIYNLWIYFKNRKTSIQNPYDIFLSSLNNLSKDDDNYFVNLTAHFKVYIESKYICKIKGKTSTEIINEINALTKLQPYIDKIQIWLNFCDNLKFKNLMANLKEKQELHQNLLFLVKNIEEDMR